MWNVEVLKYMWIAIPKLLEIYGMLILSYYLLLEECGMLILNY